METKINDRVDATGCIQGLADALGSPELVAVDSTGSWSKATEAAALAVAEALGRCRLFGVEPGDQLDGSLSPALATAAARGLARQAVRLVDELADAAEGYRRPVNLQQEDALEIDHGHRILQCVEDRLDMWAACTALREAYPEEKPMTAEIRQLAAAVSWGLAAVWRANKALVAEWPAVAKALEGTRVRENWLAMLAGPFKEQPLWLLNIEFKPPNPGWRPGPVETAVWFSRHTPKWAQISQAASMGFGLVINDQANLSRAKADRLQDREKVCNALADLVAGCHAKAVFGCFSHPILACVQSAAEAAVSVGDAEGWMNGIPLYAAWNIRRSVAGGKPTMEHKEWLLVGRIA